MKLYLIQHGASVEKDIDPEQPLSDKGKDDIRRLANFLSHHDILVSRLYHSGKLRAQETAELLLPSITSLNGIEVLTGIAPMDAIEPIVNQINTWSDDTILVGHLPFLSKCVSRLIQGNENNTTVSFERGSMVCLEKLDKLQNWAVDWMIRPELLID